eukprot:3068786-Pleurochrysis_carterae.AAC.1
MHDSGCWPHCVKAVSSVNHAHMRVDSRSLNEVEGLTPRKCRDCDLASRDTRSCVAAGRCLLQVRCAR